MKFYHFRYFPISSRQVWLALIITVCGAAPAHATDADNVDRLTQKWLDTERQASHLQSDWKTQSPLLEQRLSLLKAEKTQLQEILKESSESQNDVDDHRAKLLAEQDVLEHQQQELSQALTLLQSRINELGVQLPPPLKAIWLNEQNVLGEKPEISMRLQVVLAQLSHLADFDRRISINEAPITQSDGSEILVKQLYLGVGMAWFSSPDGKVSGWGQASEGGWQWHIDDSINTTEITKAIAIFEKHRQADFVRLPVKLATNVENHHKAAH